MVDVVNFFKFKSLLGPILFIIYISDINKYLPRGCFVEKNAEVPQTVVDSAQKWCDDNLMTLNASKCKILHFPA